MNKELGNPSRTARSELVERPSKSARKCCAGQLLSKNRLQSVGSPIGIGSIGEGKDFEPHDFLKGDPDIN